MNKKILIACYEIPGHGGASTSSYSLFQMMQNDGLKVYYMNIIRPDHEVYYKYVFGADFGNPKNLDNVFNCVLEDKLFPPEPHIPIIKIINEVKPDLILGVNYIASLLIKEAIPEIPLIYYASGCIQIQELLKKKKIHDFLSFYEEINKSNIAPNILNYHEKKTIEKSNLILTHSEITKFSYEYFYYSHIGKIYDDVIWYAEWIYNDALGYSNLSKPFSDRDIDFIFIASIWNRFEKNHELLNLLLSELKGYNIHVVGDADSKFDFVTYHNVIGDRNKLFNLLGNSKTLISPSRYDAAPGVLFEASALGCNIVASKNCGNWEICNEELLVNNYNLNEFLQKAKISLTKKYIDNISYFLEKKSYKNLIDILSVFN